jgi:hypothetical protein
MSGSERVFRWMQLQMKAVPICHSNTENICCGLNHWLVPLLCGAVLPFCLNQEVLTLLKAGPHPGVTDA